MTSLPPDIDARLAVVAALQDPVRRALYLFVLAAGREVGRDEAAAAVGIRRGLAAFHLDRLAEDELLSVEYRRLSGRTGPGAGRPAKLYRVVPTDREVSLPPRSYAFAAELLARAVEASRPGGSGASADEIAHDHGRAIGQAARDALVPRPGAAEREAAFSGVLARFGYQPVPEGDEIHLRNCPFHALAEAHRPLVCGMNRAFLAGVLDGLEHSGVDARLDPRPNQCCVVITPAER
jgi:predicted ArsR family transcriptional regulator